MRPYAPVRRSTSWVATLLGVSAVLVAGLGGTLLTLWAAGVNLPFLAAEKGPRVRIPANVRPIPAYSQVTREDLIHAEKKQLHFIELAPESVRGMTVVALGPGGEQVTDMITGYKLEGNSILFETRSGKQVHEAAVVSLGGTLMSVNDIIGRVVARDKNPNFAFKEDSFLPKGTRPGVTAGVPTGMHALTVETSRLTGAHGLRQGDKVDLLATIPQPLLTDFDPSLRRTARPQFVSKSRGKDEKNGAETRLLAAGALIVQPVKMRAKSEASSTLTQGKRVQAIPVEEIVLAIPDEDLPQVQLALSHELTLTALAQTGRPDDKPPEKPAAMVEVLRVTRRIPAFEAISEADFVDPQSRRQDIDYVEPDAARQRKIVPFRLLPGRVVKRTIEPGEVLTEDDLLPIGTRPGVGAGIPVDRQAITLDAAKLLGSELLAVGDRLDIVGAYALEREAESRTETSGSDKKSVVTSTQAIRRETELPWSDTLGERGESWLLAIDALVIAHSEPRPAEGAAPSARTLTLAVHPRDVTAVATAAATQQIVLTAAVRSNLPEDIYPTGAPQGLARVAVCGEHLRAFRALSPWSAALRRPGWKYVSAQEAQSAGWLTDLSPFGQRVLRRNKAPGEFFTADDFFPAGTRPGMASAVPPGMRAVLLTRERGKLESQAATGGYTQSATSDPFDRVKGIELLEAGQTIDVLATRRVVYSAEVTAGGELVRTAVDLLAQGALVLQTMEAPHEGVVGAVVAAPAESVARLNEALLSAVELRLVVRPEATAAAEPSAAPQAGGGELQPFDPSAGDVRIERIVGDQRKLLVFPTAGNGR